MDIILYKCKFKTNGQFIKVGCWGRDKLNFGSFRVQLHVDAGLTSCHMDFFSQGQLTVQTLSYSVCKAPRFDKRG